VIPKKRKLTKEHFRLFKREGKVFRSPHLTLRIYAAPQSSPSRFSFVVSKKVSKKSTERNLLKRRGYAAVKGSLPDIRDGFSCVFFFKNSPKEGLLSADALEKEVTQILKEAKVLGK